MTRKAAETGPGAMALVALEQAFPEAQRIVHDDLAYRILPRRARFWIAICRPIRSWLVHRTEQKVPGLWGDIMARKAYLDDVARETSAAAVVNLGAGFDTRAYRLPGLASTPVWELDQPANTAAKRRRLAAIFGDVPGHVTLVPMDLDRGDLGEVLASHGYDAAIPTLFIWEGVTQYLSESGIGATFDFLARTASGSELVFTYTPRAFIEGRDLLGQEYLYSKMRGKEPVWLSGFEPSTIDDFVGQYGWSVTEHLGYQELHERCVRPRGRDLGWMVVERIIRARKA